jgi:hypothetical protein
MRASTVLGLPTPTKEGECESFGALAVGGRRWTQASRPLVQTRGGTSSVSPSRGKDVRPILPTLIGIGKAHSTQPTQNLRVVKQEWPSFTGNNGTGVK